jgi:hypothetical protein
MIHVNIYRNPLDYTRKEQRLADPHATLRSLTVDINGGPSEWSFPTIALVNGVPWKRAKWDEPLPADCVVEFRSIVRGGGGGNALSIGAMVATMGMSSGLFAIGSGMSALGGMGGMAGMPGSSSLMQWGGKLQSFGSAGRLGGLPETPAFPSSLSGESGSPTYNLSAQGNRARLAEPIPVVYGRFRVFPDVICNPYQWISGDDQYIKLVLGVTCGECDIDPNSIRFGDSPISQLTGFEYEIYQPGETQTLVRNNVNVISAASGVKVLPPVSSPVAVLTAGQADFNTYNLGPYGIFYVITCAAGTFSGLPIGTVLTVTGTSTKNGDYTITSVDPTGAAVQVSAMSGADESDATTTITRTSAGYGAKYKLREADETCDRMEVDFIFPSGLGTIDGSGNVTNASVTIDVIIVDSAGTTLTSSTGNVFTAANIKNPIRRSVAITGLASVGVGEEIFLQFRRSVAESTTTTLVNSVSCDQVKVFFTDVTSNADLTTMHVVIKANEQLNGEALGKVNVIVERHLYEYDGANFTGPVKTRSIAWALLDVLRNDVYGMGLSDNQIDLDALLDLHNLWDGREDYLDCTFDQSITCWEALQRIARVGRAIPVLVNGGVTFIRDGERTVRSAIFTPSNMVPGSLSINYSLREQSEPDGVDVSYTSADTWLPAHIEVSAPGGSGLRPQTVDLFGVTSVEQATREATYLARRLAYMRKTLSFQTEMDGRLLSAGLMVGLAHDFSVYTQSGEVLQADPYPFEPGNLSIVPTEALDWTGGGTPQVIFKKPDGTADGPYNVEETVTGFKVADPGWTLRTDLSAGERTSFLFFTNTVEDVIITDITPSGDNLHTITCVPYDARLHDEDT